jgi:DNA-binding response OmpR family regulator
MREQCPQLLVLDIQMPDLDGYAVCEELKRWGEPWSVLPIVFLTSLQSHALSLLGNEMGAYLRKPVCPTELLHAVRRFAGPGEPPVAECPAGPRSVRNAAAGRP